MQFKFANGEPRARAISDFQWEKSPFSKKFRKAATAQDFVNIWQKHVSPFLDTTTGKCSPPLSTFNQLDLHASSGNKSASSGASSISTSRAKKSTSSDQQESSSVSTLGSKRVTPTLVLPPSKKAKKDTSEQDRDKKIEECYSGESLVFSATIFYLRAIDTNIESGVSNTP